MAPLESNFENWLSFADKSCSFRIMYGEKKVLTLKREPFSKTALQRSRLRTPK